MQPETDLARMLATLEASREPGVFVFVSVPDYAAAAALPARAVVCEREAVTVVLRREDAITRGLWPMSLGVYRHFFGGHRTRFARRATDDFAQFVQFDEIVGLAAQFVGDHRRLAADGRDDRDANPLTL